MKEVYIVRIKATEETHSKGLWAYANMERAISKVHEMNAKKFKNVIYELEEVKFNSETEETITEDDF